LLAAIAKHSKSVAAVPNADQLNKKIIDKFYPQMDSPAFLEGMPDYGKRWSE
jgi:hypothetical protein